MKAILVIDIHETDIYRLCDVFVENGFGTTLYNQRVKLKPLPDKIDQGYPCSAYDEGYGDGWDKCLDEILGEENG